jgi:probable F420-dependent oxidoreductase
MRFGLTLPHYDFSLPGIRPATFDAVADHARAAERLGFDSVWMSDHFFYSLGRYGGDAGLLGSLEPLTTLSALAPLTERVRLGTLVLSAPFRHPAILAKSATAIDVISGGRLELGIGAGWYEDEFRAFGFEYGSVGERFALLDETVRALAALLPGGPVDLDGSIVTLRSAYNRPPPAQRPHPSIWIGAKGGDRALRLVARHADGWNTVWRWSPAAYAARARRARDLFESEGRDPAKLRLSVGLYAVVGEDERDLARRWEAMRAWMPGGALDAEDMDAWRRDALVGTVDQVVERVREFAEIGVDELIVSPAPIPFAIPDVSMVELIAERLIPAAKMA